MQILDKYFGLRKQILDYFGYKEDWRIIPLDDCRQYYWYLTGESAEDRVYFAKSENELSEQHGECYENSIYAYGDLERWVYRGVGYTLVVVDTHTNGNKLLSIFDNAKEMRAECKRQIASENKIGREIIRQRLTCLR